VNEKGEGRYKVTKEEVDFQQHSEDTLTGRFLTFVLGEEVFGIGIRHVTEIIGIQTIHKLPETSGYIKGIINLRGRIIPVIDMRLKFNKEEIPYSDRTCIVVVETERASAGLIVDRVAEVLTIDDIVPPPALQAARKCRAISGIGKVDEQVKLLIDCDKLFDDNEIESMEGLRRKGENQ
jgi:purine-binding chemotaxis protein CheW